ncbi:GntR family transcriptional regulator [Xanthobacter dioxanivorans]|uniref:GntR family transcriptional regulator n=1 Tax=Xanthobacter dioxanivorans TaxID=2528964 RepID=A0A974SGD0_9HYPH|nr:GntR family transcriptional regulator [Xanthobacter dioxanivorans]QRG04600.1 GntR family transcriptional regulator [Xanthobacter dioxanivorans]
MALGERDRLLIAGIPSRKDVVLGVLRDAIVEGRLAPGARLEPDRIALELGCSRMPVREALKGLEAEGLVTCYPFRGTEVSQLRADEVEELFAMRIALEGLALTRAVPGLTGDELGKMRELLLAMDDPAQREGWRALNQKFHSILNGACGWPRLIEQIDVLRRNVERYVRIWVDIGGTEVPQRQHWALYEACRARDVARAQAVLEEHFRSTAELVAQVAAARAAAPGAA